MELDELKDTWKQTPVNNPTNTNIMELIQQKSYGPVAALKRVFRKQMLMMAFIPFLLLLTNLQDLSKPLTSILFWAYVAFCIGIIVFSYRNYRITEKMVLMDGVVRTSLEQQIRLLETRMKWELIGMRCALVFFILLAELAPYFQHYRMLDKWHSLNPGIRFSAYAGLLLLQYFMNKRISDRKVGRHIGYLKHLVDQLQH